MRFVAISILLVMASSAFSARNLVVKATKQRLDVNLDGRDGSHFGDYCTAGEDSGNLVVFYDDKQDLKNIKVSQRPGRAPFCTSCSLPAQAGDYGDIYLMADHNIPKLKPSIDNGKLKDYANRETILTHYDWKAVQSSNDLFFPGSQVNQTYYIFQGVREHSVYYNVDVSLVKRFPDMPISGRLLEFGGYKPESPEGYLWRIALDENPHATVVNIQELYSEAEFTDFHRPTITSRYPDLYVEWKKKSDFLPKVSISVELDIEAWIYNRYEEKWKWKHINYSETKIRPEDIEIKNRTLRANGRHLMESGFYARYFQEGTKYRASSRLIMNVENVKHGVIFTDEFEIKGEF